MAARMIRNFAAERRCPGNRARHPRCQHRPDGGVLLLGRSLYEVYTLRRSVLQALAIGVGPTIILALLFGALFSLQASRRLKSIQFAIDRVIQGDLRERLPITAVPMTSTRSCAPSTSCSTRSSG